MATSRGQRIRRSRAVPAQGSWMSSQDALQASLVRQQELLGNLGRPYSSGAFSKFGEHRQGGNELRRCGASSASPMSGRRPRR